MNGDNVLLDTNIVIGFLSGDEKIIQYFHEELVFSSFIVSQITRMELLGYPNITHDEEKRINQFLSHVKIITISNDIENKVIYIRKKYKIKLPDAIIAATAIINDCSLITCDNDLDKLNIKNLVIENPYND